PQHGMSALGAPSPEFAPWILWRGRSCETDHAADVGRRDALRPQLAQRGGTGRLGQLRAVPIEDETVVMVGGRRRRGRRLPPARRALGSAPEIARALPG